MLYSSGPAATAAAAAGAPAWPAGWPQFGQKRASSTNWEPQFVQNAIGSLGQFQFLDGLSGPAQVSQAHLRIFAGEDHAMRAGAKGRCHRIPGPLRRALTVTGVGRNVDVDAGPDQRFRSGRAIHGALRLAIY